jgi:hypothetical protein
MSKEQHKHHEHQHAHPPKSAWHKDWRTWTVVGLMLLAMLAYVLSMDESIGPGADETGTETPAAAM